MLGVFRRIIPGQVAEFRAYLNRVRLQIQYRNQGVRIGSGCEISDCTFGRYSRLGRGVMMTRSSVGDYTYLGKNCWINRARIGKFCSIAPEVFVGLGEHTLAPYVSTHPIITLHDPAIGWSWSDRNLMPEIRVTEIGNDVWIGLRVAIRDGVKIGDGAVLATGAVVVGDVPPFAIYGGVPAKLIRYRFDRTDIEFLLEFKWWDRSEDWLRQNYQYLHDIAALRRHCEENRILGKV